MKQEVRRGNEKENMEISRRMFMLGAGAAVAVLTRPSGGTLIYSLPLEK
jgi:hypothetical protein